MTKENLFKDKRLYAVFSITLVAVMGVASITPALPKMAKALILSEAQIGWLISAFTIPGVILTPISGVLADQWGRKTILVPSLFIFGLAGFSLFFVHQFHYMLVLRVIQGIGAASLGSLNATLIGDFFKGKKLPQALGYNASVLSLSTASYPMIGGFLAGLTWYFPFAMPLLAIPIGLFILFGMPEPIIEKHSSLKSYLKLIGRNLLNKNLISIFILGTITFIILYGAFLTYIPFLLDHRFQISTQKIGLILSLSSLTTALLATQIGKLTQKFGSINLLKMAFLLYLLVSVIIPHIPSVALFIIPILLFGSAQALNIPSLQTLLVKLAPDNQRGAFMSINGMVIRLGQSLGPMVIGLGFTFSAYEGAYYLSAGMAFLGLIVLFFFVNSSKIS